MAEKLLKVTQVRSELGHVARNRGTIRALGLDRIGHSNILPDNDAVRGAIRQVRFRAPRPKRGQRLLPPRR